MLGAVMRACLSFGERFFSLTQIVEATGMDRQEVRHRLWKLETAGLITRFHSKDIPARRGRPVKEISYRATSLLAKRLNQKNERTSSHMNGWDKMWQALRVLRQFTRSDLVQICGQTSENVRCFTTAYRRAGYLRCLGKAGSRNVTWLLVKDPGPKRPPYKGDSHVD